MHMRDFSEQYAAPLTRDTYRVARRGRILPFRTVWNIVFAVQPFPPPFHLNLPVYQMGR